MTNDLPLIAHVPIPLGRQGSTLMGVAQRLIECHAAAGGESLAVLSDNRSVHLDGAVNAFVDYTRYCPREWFSRSEQGSDILLGRMGLRRRHAGQMFVPAIEAVRSAGADVALIYEGHYAAPSLPYWSELSPLTKKILYVHNPLSRTYGDHELHRLFAQADAVVFCAEHLRQNALKRLGRTSVPLQTIHNGFDHFFMSDAPRSFADCPDPLDILFAGQVAAHKGPHLLVEAVARASRLTAIPLKLTIVGSATYDATEELTAYELELRASAEAHGLNVHFVPFVDKSALAEMYRTTAIVCIPSVWPEGFPLVALEAMASGAPIVCFDAPGLLEACGDAAAFARFGDVDDLAARIVELAEDPVSRRRLSERGRQRAQGFSWTKTYDGLAALIATL